MNTMKTFTTTTLGWAMLAFAIPACQKDAGDAKTADAKKIDTKKLDAKADVDKDKGKDKDAAAKPVDNATLVTNGMKAFNERNYDAALANFTDDSEWVLVGGPDPAEPLNGKAAIKAQWERDVAAFDVKLFPTRIFDAGNLVVAQTVFQGNHKGEYGSMKPTNKDVGVEGLYLAWVDNGKIKKSEWYANIAGVMAQTGAIPGPAPAIPAAPTSAPETVKGAGDENNIATTKEIYAAFSKADWSVLDKHFVADAKHVSAADGKTSTGAAEMKKGLQEWAKAVPDWKLDAIETFVVGPYVLVRSTSTGTHKGKFGPIKATNKPVNLHEAQVIEFADGKVKTVYLYENHAEFLAQIGQLPGPNTADAVAQK